MRISSVAKRLVTRLTVLIVASAHIAGLTAASKCFANPTAGLVVNSQNSAAENGVAAKLRGTLTDAGYSIHVLDASDIVQTAPTPAETPLLVLVDAKRLTRDTAPVIEAYLHQGGHAIFLDCPAWADGAVQLKDGRFVSHEDYLATLASTPINTHFDIADTAGGVSLWHAGKAMASTNVQAAIEPFANGSESRPSAARIHDENFQEWVNDL